MPKSMVSKASKVRARSPFVGFQIPQKPLDEAGLRWAEVSMSGGADIVKGHGIVAKELRKLDLLSKVI